MLDAEYLILPLSICTYNVNVSRLGLLVFLIYHKPQDRAFKSAMTTPWQSFCTHDGYSVMLSSNDISLIHFQMFVFSCDQYVLGSSYCASHW